MKISELRGDNLIKLNDNIDKKADKGQKFTNLLKDSIKEVNQLQHSANKAGEDLALGKVDNIHEVMISAQKAKLSLDLTTTITTKAVSAYKEIMAMQV